MSDDMTYLGDWRVWHPGIGMLPYADEPAAREAAGTAGEVYPPGAERTSTAAVEARAGRRLPLTEVERRRTAAQQQAGRARVDRAREVALHEAVTLVSSVKPQPMSEHRAKVIPIADVFERYLLGGIDAVRAVLDEQSTQDTHALDHVRWVPEADEYEAVCQCGEARRASGHNGAEEDLRVGHIDPLTPDGAS